MKPGAQSLPHPMLRSLMRSCLAGGQVLVWAVGNPAKKQTSLSLSLATSVLYQPTSVKEMSTSFSAVAETLQEKRRSALPG